jgi:hypothetical protein
MVDTLIPISGPGSTGGQSQPGLSFPSLPTSLPCWVYQIIGGASGTQPVNCHDVTAPQNAQHPAPGPGQGVAAAAQGAASTAQDAAQKAKDAASGAAGAWDVLTKIGDFVRSGNNWKGLGLLWGAVMLAGVGVVIIVFGPSTKQAAGQRVQGFRNAPAQKIRGGGGGGKRSAAVSAAKAAAE